MTISLISSQAEIHLLRRLREEILRYPLGLRFSAQDKEEEEDDLHIAAFEGENLIGGLLLRPIDKDTLKLRQMVVWPTYQGKGWGTQLVKFAEEEAIRKSYKTIVLHAREQAVKFYQKLGYGPQGDLFTEVMIPHQLMKKAPLY